MGATNPSMLLRVLPPGLYLSSGTVTLTITGETAQFGSKRALYTHEQPYSVSGSSLHTGYSEYVTPTAAFFQGVTLPFNTRMSSNSVQACTAPGYPAFPPASCTNCPANTDCLARFRVIDSSSGVAASCDYFAGHSSASSALYCSGARFEVPRCLLWSGYLDTTFSGFQSHLRETSRYSCLFYAADNSVAARKTCAAGYYSTQGLGFCKTPLPGYYTTNAGSVLPSSVADKCAMGDICQLQADSSTSNTLKCVGGSEGVLTGQHTYAGTCKLVAAGYYDNSGTVATCSAGTICPRGSTAPITCSQGTTSVSLSAEYAQCVPCTGGSYCRDGVLGTAPGSELSVAQSAYYRLLGYRGTYFAPQGRKLSASQVIEEVPIRYFKDDSKTSDGSYEQLCPDGTKGQSTGQHSALAC